MLPASEHVVAERPPEIEPPARLRRRAPQAQAPLPFINLCGDYRFLRAGYWALVDAELNGVASTPTPVQAVTAQNAAACLLVAARNEIPCVEWRVARRPEDITTPALLVPIAGLTEASYVVRTARSRQTQWRRASQNGTRRVITVPLDGTLRSLKAILGLTAHEHYMLAWKVWRTFGIPLATVWFMEHENGESEAPEYRFLGLDPLPLHELTGRDLGILEEVSKRPMSQS